MQTFTPKGRLLFTGAVFSAIVLAFLVAAKAETWPLTLKKFGSQDESSADWNADPLPFYLRFNASEQNFQSQVGPPGKTRVEWPGMAEQAAEFRRIVKKEPQYKSDYPFRGVAELGVKKYAFALDAIPPDPQPEKEKPAAKPEQSEAGQSKKAADPPDKKTKPSAKKFLGYNRLYFDFNGNGDLTDDQSVSAPSVHESELYPYNNGEWVSFDFPGVEVALDIEGTKFDYACNFNGYISENEGLRYATVSLRSSDYREGEIALGGKKLRVVLFDSNCNGRFDDRASIAPNTAPNAPLRLIEGDTLLIDAPVAEKKENQENKENFANWYAIRSNFDKYRHRIGKLMDIDGRYYELKISPAGDKISLESMEVQTGNITNPNDGFSAVIYGDQGILNISGGKDAPVPVPVGRWKLLSCKIDRTKIEAAEKPASKPEKAKQSIVQALGKSILGMGGEMVSPRLSRETYVEAEATSAYKAVEVRRGETAVLPFGPPYKPQVTVSGFNEKNRTARLSLTLVGSAGEICSDLEVKGSRPSKPKFTITDPQGKEVAKGAFEYG